ncbi:MAG: PfkB family carbohydrate kinase [bacterium]
MSDNLIELMERFDGKRVLVLGDLYLDEYIWGDMEEISKEGPIPVIRIRSRTFSPGAAGNTACGLRALGGEVWVVGSVGDDERGRILIDEFSKRGIDTEGILVDSRAPTNTHTKIGAGGTHSPLQGILRVDTERPKYVDPDAEADILRRAEYIAQGADAIVVVDQVAGVVTPRILKEVVEIARRCGCLAVGDPRENAREMRGFDLILPNDREATIATGLRITDEDSLIRVGRHLLGLGNRNVIITRGEKGMSVFTGDGRISHIPAFALEVFDVAGAGDTVTAVATMALLAGADAISAAELANYAAAIAVSRAGTVSVTRDEIRDFIRRREAFATVDKICSLKELRSRVTKLKAARKRIVWTNGCFDILHAGHVAYLQRAKSLGDVLIVGLNDDASVTALKGPKRPIIGEEQRAKMLAALECVDYVLIFSGTSPAPILEILEPDVYAKGGDYTLETLNQNERRIVEGYGGEIALLPHIEGESTSNIVNKIISSS